MLTLTCLNFIGDEEYVVFLSKQTNLDINQVKNFQEIIDYIGSTLESESKIWEKFYLLNPANAQELEPLLKFIPSLIDRWLGLIAYPDFEWQLHFTGTLFVTFCEYLLQHDPNRGANLWHKLFASSAINNEKLVKIVFKMPDSDTVNTLRETVLDIKNCNNDQSLFDIVYTAIKQGKEIWLRDKISQDLSSAFT